MDLILRGGNLPDGRENVDIGIESAKIVVVEANLQATAAAEIDVRGRLITPALCRRAFSPRRHVDRGKATV